MSENEDQPATVEEDSVISDELAAIDALSAMLDGMEETAAEPETGDEEEEESQDFPKTLENVPEEIHPEDRIACKTCPQAKWLGSKSQIKCWCREMFQIVYDSETDSDEPNFAIEYCDRKRD